MNMFARFDENPTMTLRVIKETKRYGRTDARTDGRTHGRTDGQRENSIPPTNKVCGGYNNYTLLPKGLVISYITYGWTTLLCKSAYNSPLRWKTNPGPLADSHEIKGFS